MTAIITSMHTIDFAVSSVTTCLMSQYLHGECGKMNRHCWHDSQK